jgi:hypothetical protein
VRGTGTGNGFGGVFTALGTAPAVFISKTAGTGAALAIDNTIGGGTGLTLSQSGTIGAMLITKTGSNLALAIDCSGGTAQGLQIAPNATRAPINLGSIAGNPSTLVEGDMWFDTTANNFKGYNGVAVVTF